MDNETWGLVNATVIRKRMNTAVYKEICSRPNVLSKHILNKTLSILIKESAPEVKIIQSILKVKAIPFPE